MSDKSLSELQDLDSLISAQERRRPDAVYAAKLHSVLQLQRRLKTDESIEQRLGIRLLTEHRHRYAVGQSEDLQVLVSWLKPPNFGVPTEGVTRGRVSIFLGQSAIGAEGSDWEFDALELLKWLTERWAVLLLTEDPADSPRNEFDTSEGGVNFVDAFRKAPVAKFLLLRQGTLLRVLHDNAEVLVPFDSVRSTLEVVGDVIARRLKWLRAIGAISTADVGSILDHWQDRNVQSAENVVQIATRQTSDNAVAGWLVTRLAVGFSQGLSGDEGEVQTGLIANSTKRVDISVLPERPRRLLAAARMLRPLASDSALEVLRDLEGVAFSDVAENLVELRSRSIVAYDRIVASNVNIGRPAHVGHALALWLREELGLGVDEPSDPVRILKSLGVRIREVRWGTDQIDAVACWQEAAQPVVFLNLNGRHSEGEGGRRASLAHELCHILFDADGAFPLIEVLGGILPRRIEQIARAFQAEFLLPRVAAVQVLVDAVGVDEALAVLTSKFVVSQQLAANQILNGGPPLLPREKARLDTLAQWRGKIS